MTRLAGRHFLLVYGLAGEVYLALKPLGVDYMGAQAAWLRAQGATVEMVAVPTAGAIAGNAVAIAAALRASPVPATVIAHSKGGLETLAALVMPGVAAHCAGLVALQSPFGGSYVADRLVRVRALHASARRLSRWLRTGDGAGLLDLTSGARAAWMASHHAAVAAVLAQVPVLAVASVLRDTAKGPDRRYLPLARWMARHGCGESDGLVTVESALLPGARHLVLEAGHRGLVATGAGRDCIGALEKALAALEGPPVGVAA